MSWSWKLIGAACGRGSPCRIRRPSSRPNISIGISTLPKTSCKVPSSALPTQEDARQVGQPPKRKIASKAHPRCNRWETPVGQRHANASSSPEASGSTSSMQIGQGSRMQTPSTSREKRLARHTEHEQSVIRGDPRPDRRLRDTQPTGSYPYALYANASFALRKSDRKV